MLTDSTIDQSTLERVIQAAKKRDQYIQTRLRQIRTWNMVGWLLWVLLAVACFWLYQQKPLYLNPKMLAGQLELGKMPTNEIIQLAALGSLIFWGFIALLAAFIFQIYTAMYSERKLIRLFETLHQNDLALYQAVEAGTQSLDLASTESTRNDIEQ
ncbi:MAG: hypothetical protein NVS3B3_06120 [Aquirhabdus sp.]